MGKDWKKQGCEGRCYVVIEAADACQLRRCKYVEVSATLGHRVDELLVGVAKQIQLMTRRLGSSGRQSSTSAAGACGSASGVNDNARSTRSPLWSTVGRIKAATRFVVRGLFGKPPSSCSDLMKPWTHRNYMLSKGSIDSFRVCNCRISSLLLGPFFLFILYFVLPLTNFNSFYFVIWDEYVWLIWPKRACSLRTY